MPLPSITGGVGGGMSADEMLEREKIRGLAILKEENDRRKARIDKSKTAIGGGTTGEGMSVSEAIKPEWRKNLEDMAYAAGQNVGPLSLLSAGIYKVVDAINQVEASRRAAGEGASKQIGDLKNFAKQVETSKIGFTAEEAYNAVKNSTDPGAVRQIFETAMSQKVSKFVTMPKDMISKAVSAVEAGAPGRDVVSAVSSMNYAALQQMRVTGDVAETSMRRAEQRTDVSAAEENVKREGYKQRIKVAAERAFDKAQPGLSTVTPRPVWEAFNYFGYGAEMQNVDALFGTGNSLPASLPSGGGGNPSPVPTSVGQQYTQKLDSITSFLGKIANAHSVLAPTPPSTNGGKP